METDDIRPAEERVVEHMVRPNKASHVPTVRELFPQLSEQELQEAEENLVEYLKIVVGIADRLRRERGDFDGPACKPYDKNERSTFTK